MTGILCRPLCRVGGGVLPWIQPLPFLPRTAVLTALIVVTMTWMVMPKLTRMLRGFLNPPRKG